MGVVSSWEKPLKVDCAAVRAGPDQPTGTASSSILSFADKSEKNCLEGYNGHPPKPVARLTALSPITGARRYDRITLTEI